jgi:phosphate transport system substrate-binding protein
VPKTTQVRRRLVAGAAALIAGLAACAGDADVSDVGAVSLTGAGATFPFPMYSKWFAEYNRLHPNIQINYQSIGSGGGIRLVSDGVVDFGASDGPMTEQQLAEFRTKRVTDVIHFPTVLGAVVPAYNIPGVTATLQFTPDALAGIFLGRVTKWNDPLIASANPGVTLPASDIVVVHRADGSGTTYVWVDYLSKISEEWRQRVGVATSVSWPAGLGGNGNEGVMQTVRQTPGAIGYVELIYAMQTNTLYGSVQNAAGNFVAASLASVTAAATGAAANMPEDFRISITNAPGPDAYPVSSFTWLLVPTTFEDPAKRQVVVDFLNWMLGDGQEFTEALHYARLPAPVVAMEREAIGRIR